MLAQPRFFLPSLVVLALDYAFLTWLGRRRKARPDGWERDVETLFIFVGSALTIVVFLSGGVAAERAIKALGPRWWPWFGAAGVLAGGYGLYRWREAERQVYGAAEIVFGMFTGAGQLVVVFRNGAGSAARMTALVALMAALYICVRGFDNWHQSKKPAP